MLPAAASLERANCLARLRERLHVAPPRLPPSPRGKSFSARAHYAGNWDSLMLSEDSGGVYTALRRVHTALRYVYSPEGRVYTC